MGLLDGRLCAVEASVHAAALALARTIVEEGADVVTLLCGADLGEADARRIAEAICELDEDLVVEIKDGGQPLYPLQIVAE